jgi:hypothetical protein
MAGIRPVSVSVAKLRIILIFRVDTDLQKCYFLRMENGGNDMTKSAVETIREELKHAAPGPYRYAIQSALEMAIRVEYAPYDMYPEFQEGYDDYMNDKWRGEKYKDVAAQAYDRGSEAAMRVQREENFENKV